MFKMIRGLKRVYPSLEGLYKVVYRPQGISKLPDLVPNSQPGYFGNNNFRTFSLSSSLLKHQTPLPDDQIIFIDVKGKIIIWAD